uniref:Uncharacterized protein n=1 Tax=Marseillevirus LCMAC101 TaxID=2506602 RepID=A0A481YR56_9VIRU|nr:MAG: hypothetical protein LCMAC101_02430 [Marseillevirus LCMAC101]
MDGQINSGNIIVGVAIVLVVVFLAYNLGNERSNRPDSFIDGSAGGTSDVHFIHARTYGLDPKTVADMARIAQVKAGGGGQLYGAAQLGAPNIKQSLTGTTGVNTSQPHVRPTHTEAKNNPMLEHQRRTSGGNDPSVLGDPIRTPTYIGPSVQGYRLHTVNLPWRYAYNNLTTTHSFSEDVAQTLETEETKAQRPQDPIIDGYSQLDISTRGPGGPYGLGPGSGPYPGIPVPRGTLKKTSEKYGYPFYQAARPLKPYDYFKPYGPNQNVNQDANYVDTPFYDRREPTYATGYTGSGAIPFIGSVDAFAPFPEVETAWEKTGMLTTKNPEKGELLTLYRRPIAPLQDLFKYSVQDKNGFIIPLRETYLENGDTVPEVLGKEQMGPWTANIFTQDKYVWV